MKILLIDNYDSFTYNLLHLIRKSCPNAEVDVVYNDMLNMESVDKYDKIVISPGPELPTNSGCILEVIKRYSSTKSILGICLGHQAIGEAFGAKLVKLSDVCHGISSTAKKTSDDYIFNSILSKFKVGRYHSWAIDKSTLPYELEVTSTSEDGVIMSVKHKHYDVHGLQFHPESILTECGESVMKEFFNSIFIII